jgi:prepilin-type N-terminal cleavage/methylation domain-containing protein
MRELTVRRAAFTLIEMLVVLFIIVILATIVAVVAPRISEQSKSARGADQMQGWLLIAKQRAKREGHAVGLRIQVPIVNHATAAFNAGAGVFVSVQTPPGTSGTQYLNQLGQPYPLSGVPWVITPGARVMVADDDRGANAELVQVTGVSPNGFTANFTRAHQPIPGISIRLLGYANTLQYIEQPDDFVATGWPLNPNAPFVRPLSVFNYPLPPFNGPVALLAAWPPGTNQQAAPDFGGGWSQGQPYPPADQWPVQPGDYLELYGGGQVHQITGVGTYTIPNTLFNPPFPSNNPNPAQMPPMPPPNPPYPNQSYVGLLTLQSLPANAGSSLSGITGITQWRIIRAPRVLRGEPDLQLPQNVVIDLGTNFDPTPYSPYSGQAFQYNGSLPIDPGTGSVDILFSPSGAISGRSPGTSGPTQVRDRIVLWVRDAMQDPPPDPVPGYAANDPNHVLGTAEFGGQPTLITIYRNTGFIAAHPVDPTPGPQTSPPTPPDPLRFTEDGRSSGL